MNAPRLFSFPRTMVVPLFCGAVLLAAFGCSEKKNSPTTSTPPPPTGLETDSMMDVDGNSYVTVKIGDQWWMAENLKVTSYRNGDPIPELADTADWLWATGGGYCHLDNNSANTATYGLLYNGFTVDDVRNLAPAGWHVPSDSEWQVLEDFLGASNAGAKTKTTGTTLWNSPNLGATNESGFSALPAGVRPPAGIYTNRGEIAFFWSTTQAIPPPLTANWMRGMGYAELTFRRQQTLLQMGLSVRCVKD